MKHKIGFIVAISLLWGETSLCQVARWQNPPMWENVEAIGKGLLRIKKADQCGVVDFTGKEIVPLASHTITNICEDRFLVLGEDNIILSLRNTDGKEILLKDLKDKKHPQLDGVLYADPDWPYFSQGLLAVQKGKGGLWGFLDKEGILTIKSEYRKARPFCFDYAVVKLGNNKGWRFISRSDGELSIDKGFIGTKSYDYLSSYTNIEGNMYSLVWTNDRLYLIDRNKNKTDFVIPASGIEVSEGDMQKLDSITTISRGDYVIKIDNRGEIVLIKAGGNTYYGTIKNEPLAYSVPPTDDIETDEAGRIKAGSLIVSPQFSEVIPLRATEILVKNDKKWGMINLDWSKSISLAILPEEKLANSRTTNVKFKLSRMQEGIRAYVVNADKEKKFFEIQDSIVCVPFECAKDDTITLGVEMDGILTEPCPFAIPRRNIRTDLRKSGRRKNQNRSGENNPKPKNKEEERKSKINKLK